MKYKPNDRVLPTVMRGGVIKTEWFRRFGFWERVAILFGSPLVVMIGVACQHNPGKVQPLIMGKVSKHLTPDAHMQEIINNMIVRNAKEAEKA